MRILITGGTGSLGRALTAALLREYSTERVVIYSRDEVKQAAMAAGDSDDRVRFFLGDVRDEERLREAMAGVDTVVHAAALKRIDSVSYNPQEVLKTNILGTRNVLHAAAEQRIPAVLVISSDKAVHPANLYGASKLMAEFLTVRHNVLSFPFGTACSVLRYGNVWGSRGAVAELFAEQASTGRPLTVTDPTMTRFYLTLPMAAEFVLESLRYMRRSYKAGGEIFVPLLSAWSVGQVARAFAPPERWTLIGRRPGGEKMHEELLAATELDRVVLLPAAGLFAVVPDPHEWCLRHWLEFFPRHAIAAYRSNLVDPVPDSFVEGRR